MRFCRCRDGGMENTWPAAKRNRESLFASPCDSPCFTSRFKFALQVVGFSWVDRNTFCSPSGTCIARYGFSSASSRLSAPQIEGGALYACASVVCRSVICLRGAWPELLSEDLVVNETSTVNGREMTVRCCRLSVVDSDSIGWIWVTRATDQRDHHPNSRRL